MTLTFEPGSTVWAPYADGEYRFRVIAVDGDELTLKRPGSDAGIFTVAATACYHSEQPPHSLEHIAAADARHRAQ